MHTRTRRLLSTLAAGALSAPLQAATSLDWLAGSWCLAGEKEVIEEFWLPGNSDLLLGMSRTTRQGKTASFEFMRISLAAGKATYHAQPAGAAATAFTQTASGENWIRFENPQHDFPRRIEYRRNGKALHAEIAGPGKNGQETVIPFDYQRCATQGS